MLSRPTSCYGCPLHEKKIAIGFSQPEGTGALGVLVMAEALGRHEASDGLPLRPNAPAGSIFAQVLRRAGIDRQQLVIANTIWCQPGPQNWLEGRYEEYQAIRHCQVHNAELVERFRPRAILAMGNVPTRTLTGLVGHNLGIKMVRGFIIPGLGPDDKREDDVPWGDQGPQRFPAAGVPVIPTYHPSFLLRGSKSRSKETGGKTEKAEGGMALAGVLRRDLELAIQVAKNGWTKPPVNYRFLTNRDEAQAFYEECKANPHLPLGVDIETPESRSKADDESEIEQVTLPVTQIQFSLRKFEGVVFPGFDVEWSRDISAAILALPNIKLTWNGWSFDEPNIGQYGIKMAGVHHDLMWAWHFLQPDLPKGLQYATSFYAPEMGIWKHLAGVDDGYYGGCDVDSLQRDAEGIFSALQGRGLYNTYERHVVQLHTVLVNTSNRGIPVNAEAQKIFGDRLIQEIGALDIEIQKKIPMDIRPLKQKEGLVKAPKKVAAILETMFPSESQVPGALAPIPLGTVVVVPDEFHCQFCEVSQKNHDTAKDAIDAGPHEAIWVPDVYTLRELEYKAKEKKEKGTLDEVLEKPAKLKALRWALMKDFSVNSGDQIKAYILWKREEEIAARMAKGQDRNMALRLAKYQVPMEKDKQTKKLKESTSAKELLKLSKKTGDSLFTQIIEVRQMSKMSSTYIDGWKPDKQGLVHTEFLMAPATGQLSCSAAWTPVTTKRGIIPISEVALGDEVWTHKLRWKPIIDVWKAPAQPMYNVTLSSGEVLTCTDAHRVLCLEHEHMQEMDQREEHQRGVATLSISGVADRQNDCACVAFNGPHGRVDYSESVASGGVQSPSKGSLLPIKDSREESTVRQAGRRNSQLEGPRGRWTRISDLFSQWEAGVRASSSSSEDVGIKTASLILGASPHRREQEEQLSGQFGNRYENWAQANSLSIPFGFQAVRIEAIDRVGSYEVYDITVADDESYETCGVFSHNSVNPNAQNVPKHGKLGDEFRRTIQAQPGHVLLEFDKKSFHAQTLAFEAQDPAYFRLAKIDVHSFVTCHMIKHPQRFDCLGWSDADLTKFLEELKADDKTTFKAAANADRPYGSTFKQIRDEQAKKTILGIGFGQGANSIYAQNEENFESPKDVQKILDLLKELFKPIFKFQDDIRKVAHNQNYLISRYKYIRRFHDVFRWDSDKWNASTGSMGMFVAGDDSEAAIAFLPANDAFGMIKDEMLRLEEDGSNEQFLLCNQIHDALKFHCPLEYEDECIEHVVSEMSKPSPFLVDSVIAPAGLAIEVGVVRGFNWAKGKKDKNPEGMFELGLGEWARRKVA